MIDNGGADTVDGSPHRRWAAMHDGVNVYILALVDDNKRHQSDSASVWEDDAFEVFNSGKVTVATITNICFRS